MAEKLFRDYFYNYKSLKKKMRIFLAKKGLSKSEWIRAKEIEALKRKDPQKEQV